MKPVIISSPEALAEVIKARRKSLGATQTDLASMHAVSRYTIVDAESGNGDPKLSTLLNLLGGLGLKLAAVPNEMTNQLLFLETEPVNQDENPGSGIDDWDFDEEIEP